MEKTHWYRIEQVFHAALAVPHDRRPELIRSLAGDDASLGLEVQSLIDAFRDDETWLTPESEDQLRDAVETTMQLLLEPKADAAQAVESRGSKKEVDATDAERSAFDPFRDRFDFERLLGRGGMGIVAQAFDRSMRRRVALKLLPPLRTKGADSDRAFRESQAIAGLHSDHIVNVYEIIDRQPAPCLVMEYIRGPSVRRLIAARKRLPARFAAEIARQVAVGVSHAHAQGQLHGDIKPSNILLQRKASRNHRWRAKLIDFGLSRTLAGDVSLSNLRQFYGTPAYMSPEQLLRNDAIDERSDVYSLGVVLYEMLVGEPPFRGTPTMILRSLAHLYATPPRALDEAVPKDLESICLKGIAKNPRDRYASATAMADDLHRFLEGLPTLARPLSAPTKVFRWIRRNPMLSTSLMAVTLCLLLLCFGSLLTSWMLWDKNRQIASQQTRVDQSLLQKLSGSSPAFVSAAISQIEAQIDQPVPALKQLYEQQVDAQGKLNLACALVAFGEPMEELLVDAVENSVTESGQCNAFLRAFSAHPERALTAIAERLSRTSSAKERVKLAMIAFRLGEPKFAVELTTAPERVEERTLWIHLFPGWHPDLDFVIDAIEPNGNPHLLYANLLGLGMLENFPANEALGIQLNMRLQTLGQESRDSQVRAAARWLGQQFYGANWKLTDGTEPSSKQRDIAFEMVYVPGGAFLMGNNDPSLQYTGRTSHPVVLTQDFMIADREVSVREYRRFLEDSTVATDAKPANASSWSPDEVISPTLDHPAQQVSWSDAVLYCNWLSQRHGLRPAYIERARESIDVDGESKSWEVWQRDSEANGYRLPTEAEFEYACRAGTQTQYFFGDDRKFLDHYIAWSNNTRIPSQPCGTLMPNPLGLFDMLGNVWEWSDDRFRDFPAGEETDPRSLIPNPRGFAFRGGGICTFSGDPLCSSRGAAPPDAAFLNLGFRVARNANE